MLETIVPSMRRQRNCDPPPKPEQALSFRLAAVGVFVAAVLAALALVTPALAKPLSKADRAFVDATVEAAMQEEGQPGVEISISGPKGSYTQAYGVRDLASGAPLMLGDHVHMGSITKTFTATAILRQVEEGHLSLSDTLDKWVTGIPNGNEITVRQLLAMQSGVFEYQADQEFQEKVGANLLTPFGPQDFLEIMRRHEPYFAPGEATLYTSSNYYLLGLILEQVTGESAEAAITKDVIKPLGLHHTSFPTTPQMPRPFTRGYCGAPGALEDCTEFTPGIVWTAGAMISTLGDLSKYGQQLGTGALLSLEMQEERLQFSGIPYPFEGPSEFGYGLGIISFGNWLGHDGSVPGSSTETFYEPQTGAVIAGMETLQTPTLAIFSRIFERIGDHLYPGSMETPEYP
jgi:D-alanyl-D-alanine carboxypeptidase